MVSCLESNESFFCVEICKSLTLFQLFYYVLESDTIDFDDDGVSEVMLAKLANALDNDDADEEDSDDESYVIQGKTSNFVLNFTQCQQS